MEGASPELTLLLVDLSEGKGDHRAAYERLYAAAYDELKRMAGRLMRRERANHTLCPTALVHELYLKLVDETLAGMNGRTHFYGIAARAMRQILVDHARRRAAGKRGGHWNRVTLDEGQVIARQQTLDLLALDRVLEKLTALDERAARVVELKVFAGLSSPEAAQVLGVSQRTVDSDWKMARMWLGRELAGGAPS